ncbi:hypothetical protein FNW02_20510 [Komarekiella sp. 'clone 1']|uniref:Uncharacterized protein n=1 Tax=Komarekiella delphini-convector SJRDD-AB1 TaxID=2593771 RepID=A0AA40T019_9NOST|nr:hypothetical protein [Komarekiella delphini-convector SJRDD-AB1]
MSDMEARSPDSSRYCSRILKAVTIILHSLELYLGPFWSYSLFASCILKEVGYLWMQVLCINNN